MTDVVVAIPTFQRADLLRRALAEVSRQVASPSQDGSWRATVLVVDNDPAASARKVAHDAGARYVPEPRPGLAAVRNRALDETTGADVLVFLDDDEVPDPGWLDALVGRHLATGASAVAGPVVTALPPDADAWVRASYVRPHRVDGQLMRAAATNNLLLDLHVVRALGLRFDDRLAFSGGEDSLFTSELVRRGGQIRWAQDALVRELVGPERLGRRWILRRAVRAGNAEAFVARYRAGTGPRERLLVLVLALQGLVRIGVGSLGWCVATVLRSPARAARAARTAARGLGRVRGAFGRSNADYMERHRQVGVTA